MAGVNQVPDNTDYGVDKFGLSWKRKNQSDPELWDAYGHPDGFTYEKLLEQRGTVRWFDVDGHYLGTSTKTDRRTIEFTVYSPKRKQVLYDREDLAAVLSIFVNWAEGNGWVDVETDITYGEIIHNFMHVMSGENVAPQ